MCRRKPQSRINYSQKSWLFYPHFMCLFSRLMWHMRDLFCMSSGRNHVATKLKIWGVFGLIFWLYVFMFALCWSASRLTNLAVPFRLCLCPSWQDVGAGRAPSPTTCTFAITGELFLLRAEDRVNPRLRQEPPPCCFKHMYRRRVAIAYILYGRA